jgi:hypothetical protein
VSLTEEAFGRTLHVVNPDAADATDAAGAAGTAGAPHVPPTLWISKH